jgi:hypothetical protein
MAKPIKSFRDLKVGDKVRLVEIPKFYRVGYNIHRDTMWVYRQILARKRPMRIWLIDEWGLPWVQCRFRRKDGRWRHDSLGLDKEGWVLVEPRSLFKRRPAAR